MINAFTSLYHRYHLGRIALAIILLLNCSFVGFAQKLKVVVAGLNHDNVHNILHAFNNGEVTIIGIAEPNRQLWAKFGKQYHLPQSLFTPI